MVEAEGKQQKKVSAAAVSQKKTKRLQSVDDVQPARDEKTAKKAKAAAAVESIKKHCPDGKHILCMKCTTC